MLIIGGFLFISKAIIFEQSTDQLEFVSQDFLTALDRISVSSINDTFVQTELLAGGINPDNVLEGIEKTQAWGVDSCTGTNKLDSSGAPVRFQKDMKKVRQMVDLVRSLE